MPPKTGLTCLVDYQAEQLQQNLSEIHADTVVEFYGITDTVSNLELLCPEPPEKRTGEARERFTAKILHMSGIELPDQYLHLLEPIPEAAKHSQTEEAQIKEASKEATPPGVAEGSKVVELAKSVAVEAATITPQEVYSQSAALEISLRHDTESHVGASRATATAPNPVKAVSTKAQPQNIPVRKQSSAAVRKPKQAEAPMAMPAIVNDIEQQKNLPQYAPEPIKMEAPHPVVLPAITEKIKHDKPVPTPVRYVEARGPAATESNHESVITYESIRTGLEIVPTSVENLATEMPPSAPSGTVEMSLESTGNVHHVDLEDYVQTEAFDLPPDTITPNIQLADQESILDIDSHEDDGVSHEAAVAAVVEVAAVSPETAEQATTLILTMPTQVQESIKAYIDKAKLEAEPEAVELVEAQIVLVAQFADKLHVLAQTNQGESQEAIEIESLLKEEYVELLTVLGVEFDDETIEAFIKLVRSEDYIVKAEPLAAKAAYDPMHELLLRQDLFNDQGDDASVHELRTNRLVSYLVRHGLSLVA